MTTIHNYVNFEGETLHIHKWLIASLLLLAALLAACDTAAPAVDLSSMDLAQTISVDAATDINLPLPSGLLTIGYPADWFATYDETTGTFTFTNVESLDLLTTDIEAGQAFLSIQLFETNTIAVFGGDPNGAPADNALAVLNGFTGSMQNLGQPIQFDEPQIIDIGVDGAAFRTGTSASTNTTAPDASGDVMFITRANTNAVYMAVGATAQGEAQDFRDEFLAIIASASVE